jgi:tmRNA-binding protein
MAVKLKIEKSGDEIIPLEMHFFVDSLLLVTQIIKGKQLFTKCEVGKAKF